MSVPIYAPNIATYATRQPYITPAEYIASPTGVDVSQLVPGGNPVANADALTQTIARASSWADQICRQVLAATIDTQAGRYRVQRNGAIRVPVDQTPLIAVTGISIGSSPSTTAAMTSVADVWLSRKVVEIGMASLAFAPFGRAGFVFASVSYVNGYANTTLASTAASGASTISPKSAVGFAPGLSLTLFDPGLTETVTVLSIAGGVVTLTAPLAANHLAGVSVSAFPAAIKQAVVLLTSALIKTRGDGAMVMQSMTSEPTGTTPTQAGGNEDQTVAEQLLAPFRRAV